MRGHRKAPIEGQIVEPEYQEIGQMILKAAQVKLVGEDEWEAADDAITEGYDALLAAKEFLETIAIIAPFHPELNRLSKRLKEVSEFVESSLCVIERYLEMGKQESER